MDHHEFTLIYLKSLAFIQNWRAYRYTISLQMQNKTLQKKKNIHFQALPTHISTAY